jgi:hypothetical protein
MMMKLAETAWLCRIKAREATGRCRFQTAAALVAKTQEIHAAESGRQLSIFTERLDTRLFVFCLIDNGFPTESLRFRYCLNINHILWLRPEQGRQLIG